MEYRQFGHSGPTVPALGLGAANREMPICPFRHRTGFDERHMKPTA